MLDLVRDDLLLVAEDVYAASDVEDMPHVNRSVNGCELPPSRVLSGLAVPFWRPNDRGGPLRGTREIDHTIDGRAAAIINCVNLTPRNFAMVNNNAADAHPFDRVIEVEINVLALEPRVARQSDDVGGAEMTPAIDGGRQVEAVLRVEFGFTGFGRHRISLLCKEPSPKIAADLLMAGNIQRVAAACISSCGLVPTPRPFLFFFIFLFGLV